MIGEVLEADRFGSLRFNIPAEDLDELGLDGRHARDHARAQRAHGPVRRARSRTCAEGEPVALVDSSGWLTLAVNTGSAADRYGVEPGAHVRVQRRSS